MRTDGNWLRSAFRRLLCLAATISLGASAATAGGFDPKHFEATGSFELVVKASNVLRPGTTRISARSAFASRLRGGLPGNVDGIEIVFVTRPITAAVVPDIVGNGAKALRRADYAAIVLFLDRDDRVSQVNLSYVVPGTTVARTVAWKPDDLRKYFSRVTVRGGRVVLRSKGTYSESDPAHEALTLSWDIDADLPVIREVPR
jgi:hypothetical protein